LDKDVNALDALIQAFRAGAAGAIVGGTIGGFTGINGRQKTPQEVGKDIVKIVKEQTGRFAEAETVEGREEIAQELVVDPTIQRAIEVAEGVFQRTREGTATEEDLNALQTSLATIRQGTPLIESEKFVPKSDTDQNETFTIKKDAFGGSFKYTLLDPNLGDPNNLGENEITTIVGSVRNNSIRIENAGVIESERGKGFAVRGYMRIAKEAFDRGLSLESDVEVTQDAVNVYAALERRGLTVNRASDAHEVVDGGITKLVARGSVFKIPIQNLDVASSINPAPEFSSPLAQQRGFSRQISQDPKIAPPLAASQQENNVQPITNLETLREAQEFIDAQPTINDAIIKVLDFSSNMPGRVRVTVGSQIIVNLNKVYLEEIDAGNTVEANAVMEKTISLADNISSFLTESGRTSQAAAMYTRLVPQAFIKKLGDMKAKSAKTGYARDEAIRQQITEGIQIARRVAVRESVDIPELQELKGIIESIVDINENILFKNRIADALSESDLGSLQNILQEVGVRDVEKASVVLRDNYQSRIEKSISVGLAKALKTTLQAPVNTSAQGFNTQSQVKDMLKFVQGRMTETNLYSDAAVDTFVREWYDKNIPPVTQEENDTIIRMAIEMNQRPDGFLRTDAANELIGFMTRSLGVRGQLAEVASAQWYSGIFSGIGTQEVNVTATAANVLLHAFEMAAAIPHSIPSLLNGYASGASVGVREFQAAIAGKATPKTPAKLELTDLLQQFYNPSKPWWNAKNLITIGRFTRRILVAPDVFWFRTVEEGVAQALGDDYLRRQDKEAVFIPRREFREYVSQLLFNTETDIAAFEVIARQDLAAAGRLNKKSGKVNKRDLDRRIYELMLEKRRTMAGGPTRAREAVRQAERATFTAQPEGLLQGFAAAATTAIRKTIIQTPYGTARVLTPVIPVVRIMANVGDRLLDFGPVGILRGVRGKRTFGEGKRFSPIEARGRLWLGITGTMFIPFLSAIVSSFGEENEEENNGFIFDITGQGPKDFRKRQQWREQGKKEWSVHIKIPGVIDHYASYIEQPFALPYMFIGATRDTEKYENIDIDSVFEVASFSAFVVSSAFLDQQFVRGVADALEVVEGKRDPLSYLASPIAGFVGFGPFFSALARDISNITDPVMRDPKSVGFVGQLLKNVPYLKSVPGKPVINVLGEEVRKTPLEQNPLTRRFLSQTTKDPVWKWLAKNKLFVPDPRRSKEITIMTSRPNKIEKGMLFQAFDKRRTRMGAIAAGVMTEDEVYDFIKRRGDIIKFTLNNRIKTSHFEDLRTTAIAGAKAQGYDDIISGMFGHAAVKKSLESIAIQAGDIAKRELAGIPSLGLPTPKRNLIPIPRINKPSFP